MPKKVVKKKPDPVEVVEAPAKEVEAPTVAPKKANKKIVTILGFGPSWSVIQQDAKIVNQGEIWSLNHVYDSEPGMALKDFGQITRIFEMHDFKKGEKEVAKNGKPHYWCLGELGKRGVKIVMQQEHPLITNSEPFPRFEAQAIIAERCPRAPNRMFKGTPCYAAAMAIMERYDLILSYGIDHIDMHHMPQRVAYACWMFLAMGMGIQVGGHLGFLEYMDERLYGYDYGPEWDDGQQDELFAGFPFTVIMKDPKAPKAQAADLWQNRKEKA